MNVHNIIIHMSQKWKQVKCLLTDYWISNVWHIHTVEYYLTIKRNKALIHATAGVTLKYYAKWKNLVKKSHLLSDTIYRKCPV